VFILSLFHATAKEAKREEITRNWRKLRNKELHNVTSPDTVQMSKQGERSCRGEGIGGEEDTGRVLGRRN
jgi:hypothetical protein